MGTLLIIILRLAIKLVNAAVWAYVILSWIIPMNRSQQLVNIYMTLAKYIEPFLAPIRKLMAPLTYRMRIDFSPYVLVLLVSWIGNILSRLIYSL